MKLSFLNRLVKRSANPNKSARSDQIKTVIVMVGVGGLVATLYFYRPHAQPIKKQETHHLSGAFGDDVGMSYDHARLQVLMAKIDKADSKISELQKQKDSQSTTTHTINDSETVKQLQNLYKELGALKKKVKTLSEEPVKPVSHTPLSSHDQAFVNASNLKTAYAPTQSQALPAPIVSNMGIDDVVISYPEEKKQAEQRTPKNYVWAGTFATGYMITGVIGDAGTNATKNKGTVAIRLTSTGTMPNGKHSHLEDCVVLGSSYGDLSSNSDVIHLETLSCAGKKYSFEKKVYGSVFDSDAMQDLRGIPVLKAKPILSYAAAAGFIAGIGKGVSSSGTTSTVTGSGVVQTPTSVLRAAAGEGISTPADKITDYLMQIANMYHPIVVAHAGRKVTVLFQAGFWIDKQHQNFESMKSIGNGQTKTKQQNGLEQSVITTAQQQLQQGHKMIQPDALTRQVAAASGQGVRSIAEQKAQDDFNANQLKLGEALFRPVSQG